MVDPFARAHDLAGQVVDAVVMGDHDSARNRLHELVEGVSKGDATTVSAITARLARSLDRRSSWSDVYMESEREIRAFLGGSLKSILEAQPKRRFRVLATEHAPADPSRYSEELMEALEEVVATYEAVAREIGDLDTALAEGFNRYSDLAEGAAVSSLIGFTESLRTSATEAAVEGRKLLKMKSPANEIAKVARLHDLLAEGLESFLICTNLAKKLATATAGMETDE